MEPPHQALTEVAFRSFSMILQPRKTTSDLPTCLSRGASTGPRQEEVPLPQRENWENLGSYFLADPGNIWQSWPLWMNVGKVGKHLQSAIVLV